MEIEINIDKKEPDILQKYKLILLKKNLPLMNEMYKIDEKNKAYWKKRIDKITEGIQELEKEFER